jgi:hypothetical protein
MTATSLFGSDSSRLTRGGRDRALQSGFRADWILGDNELPTRALIDLEGERRSLKPGEEALVRAYPLQPEQWRNVEPGHEIRLFWKVGRHLGLGVVGDRVNVPEETAQLHHDRIRPRPGRATLHRRRRLLDWLFRR